MKNNQLVITIIAVVVVGAVAFFGGMQYQKSQRATGANFGGGRFLRANRGSNTNFAPVRGQIISADANSITVKMQNGSSKIVVIPFSASITEATSAGKQALTTGKEVLVVGTSNSDGSITAQNVQLNPQTAMFGRGTGRSSAPSSSPSGY